MNKNKFYKYFVIVGLMCISFTAGRHLGPKSVSNQSTEQIKTDQTKNVDRNQNVIETTKETRSPDGTVVIEKRKEKETSTQTQVQKNSETSKSSSQTIENRPSYRIGMQYVPAIKGLQDSSYTGVLEKRLFSEVYVGVTASSLHVFGVSLSLGF
jgi:hypothetical protein